MTATSDSTPITLHFAHANGFPAGSYQQMFKHLPAQFEVLALEQFGHSPQYPVTRNWQHQVDEMMAYIDRHTSQPVFAVGHSFGGVVSYMAVCRYPERFKGLIMLDPPLVTGVTRHLVKAIRALGLTDRFFPSGLAATRCTEWEKSADLLAYFQSKNLFKNMQTACIEDYVSSAIRDAGDKYRLGFDNQVEAEIFRTIPLDIHRFYGKLRVPGLLLTAEHTNVCLPERIAPFIRHNQLKHEVIPDVGHMIPMEQPQQTAQRIADQLMAWQSA